MSFNVAKILPMTLDEQIPFHLQKANTHTAHFGSESIKKV